MTDKRRLTDVKVTYEVNIILSDLYNQIEYELRDDYNDSLEQLQSNWNSLREWLEEQHQFIIEIPAYTKEISIEHKTMEICYENVLDKMNELEGNTYEEN